LIEITFVGHRSDIREWLAFSDVVLTLSTQAETFGRTALEALSLGTPVIGWNRGGVAEILSRLYPQGLIQIDDQAALIKALQQQLIQLDHIPAVTAFSLDEMCNQVLALYQSVFDRKRQVAP